MKQKKNGEINLSIIIPIYNAGNYLEKCLESVVKQKVNNYEIICVNDGSTDNSLEIVNKFAKKYSFIKIINKKNEGVIKARITGYDAARGKYIGWVDADDFVNENMFSTLYNAANINNADVAYCNYNFYPSEVINKQKWYKEYNGTVNWKFIMNNTIQWNKIVKKELLDGLEIRKLFETIGEGCYGLVLINAENIISINECLYSYRVGHSSLSSNFKNVDWYKKVVEKAKNFYKYVEEKNYDKEWCEYYKYRYLYYNLILMISAAYTGNKKIFEEAKKIVKSEKLFGKNYRIYLKESFSSIKRIFFIIGSTSYFMMRIMSKITFK